MSITQKLTDKHFTNIATRFYMKGPRMYVHCTYRAFPKLPQIYTANHATFPIQMYSITVQICGNF